MLHLRLAPDTHNADLVDADDDADADLATEVLIALLTDARAEPGTLPGGVENRGWFDDGLVGEPLGSLLWLLEHAPASPDNARRAERYAVDALAYLQRDKRAKTIEAVATLDGAALVLSVRIDGVERVRGLPVTSS